MVLSIPAGYKQSETYLGPVGWGSRIQQMHLVRETPTKSVLIYDTKQSASDDPALGNTEYAFIAIAPGSNLAWSGSAW